VYPERLLVFKIVKLGRAMHNCNAMAGDRLLSW
jgi:hypothetical protein